MATKFIVAVITAESAHVDTIGQALVAAVPEVRREPGCLQYDLYRDASKPNKFVMIEQWQDAEALRQHGEAAAFQKLARVFDGRASLDVADIERII